MKLLITTIGLLLGGLSNVAIGSDTGPQTYTAFSAQNPSYILLANNNSHKHKYGKKNHHRKIHTKLNEILEAIEGLETGGDSGNDDNHLHSWNVDLTAERFVETDIDGSTLDRNSGLVWMIDGKSIAATTWEDAYTKCLQFSTDSRFGFRLGTAPELSTLVNLPAGGHPFINIFGVGGQATFWSATTDINDQANAYLVNLVDGSVEIDKKSESHGVLCVRTGHSGHGGGH